jgi:hypothetical protein
VNLGPVHVDYPVDIITGAAPGIFTRTGHIPLHKDAKVSTPGEMKIVIPSVAKKTVAG